MDERIWRDVALPALHQVGYRSRPARIPRWSPHRLASSVSLTDNAGRRPTIMSDVLAISPTRLRPVRSTA
jgi:hypothetical protein